MAYFGMGGGAGGGMGGGGNPWLQGLAQRIQQARAQFGGQMGQQFGLGGGGWNPHAGGMGGEQAPAQGQQAQGQRPMVPAWGGGMPQGGGAPQGGGMLPGGWSRAINGFGAGAPTPQGAPITTAGQQQGFAAPNTGVAPVAVAAPMVAQRGANPGSMRPDGSYDDDKKER